MKKAQELIEQANSLFESAEVTVVESQETGRQLFLQGITALFQAYLSDKGVEGTGDLSELFNECKRLEREFEDIGEELECLLEKDNNGMEPEELTDFANEIWDFVIDYVSEAECN